MSAFDPERTFGQTAQEDLPAIPPPLLPTNDSLFWEYKGITGTIPYTYVELHETVGGRSAFIVNHKAAWEIK